MPKVTIEIDDVDQAMKILSRLDEIEISGTSPSDADCHFWLDDIALKIQAAVQKEIENTWKHLSSFERFYAEINVFGDVRIHDRIYKPLYDRDYLKWITTFPDDSGARVDIDPVHFVKVHFDTDLEL